MSMFSAGAGGLGLGTIAVSAAGGAVVAAILSVGGTQIYASTLSPDKVVSNLSNVGYADQ